MGAVVIDPHAVGAAHERASRPASRRRKRQRTLTHWSLLALTLVVASVVLVTDVAPVASPAVAASPTVSVAEPAHVSAASGKDAAAVAGVQPGPFEAQYQSAVATFRQSRLEAIGRVAVARSVVASAQLTLDSSAGQVLTETLRGALAQSIRLQALRITLATAQIDELSLRASAARSGGPFRLEPPSFPAATQTLEGMRFAWASNLDSVRPELSTLVEGVRADVVAWHAEQARLAAIEAARVAEAARA